MYPRRLARLARPWQGRRLLVTPRIQIGPTRLARARTAISERGSTILSYGPGRGRVGDPHLCHHKAECLTTFPPPRHTLGGNRTHGLRAENAAHLAIGRSKSAGSYGMGNSLNRGSNPSDRLSPSQTTPIRGSPIGNDGSDPPVDRSKRPVLAITPIPISAQRGCPFERERQAKSSPQYSARELHPQPLG